MLVDTDETYQRETFKLGTNSFLYASFRIEQSCPSVRPSFLISANAR